MPRTPLAIPLRRFCLCLFACLLCPLVMVADNGASDSLRALRSRLIERFTPLMRDVAAISPDGEHLAYTLRDEENLYVIIVATKAPARCVVSYKIGSMASSRLLNPNYEPSPEVLKIVPHHVDFGRAPRIRTMLWANSKCLLAITNFTATRMDGLERYENEEGALFRLSLDGKGAKMLASVNELGREFAYVYTFQDFVMAGEDEVIIRARNSPEVPSGGAPFHAVTIQIGTEFMLKATEEKYLKEQERDKARKRALRILQDPVIADARKLFPNMEVDLLSSDDKARFLALRVHNPANPGRLYLYSAERKVLVDMGECLPCLLPRAYQVEWSDVQDRSGLQARHLLIRPGEGTYRRNGLVVLCTDKPAAPIRNGYRREVMAYLDMGYSVLQIGGLKLAGREPRHNYHAELLAHLRALPEWGTSLPGGLPKERGLVAEGVHGIDLAYLTLYYNNDLYDTGLFFNLPRVDSPPLHRKSDVTKGLKDKRPEGSTDEHTRQVLCFLQDWSRGTDSYEVLHAGRDYFAPLKSARTYVDYEMISRGAQYLNQTEEWVPVYEKVAKFLDAAFRKARVAPGEAKVIKTPAE